MFYRYSFAGMALLAIASAVVAAPVQAKAKSACLKTYEAMQIRMPNFDPALATTASDIKRTQQAGLDPNRYIVDYDGMLVQLTVKFHDLAEKAIAQSADGAADCRQELAPYLSMAELKAIYQSYGLTALVPPELAATDYVAVLKSGRAPAAKPGLMPAANPMPMQQMAVSGMMAKMIKAPYCIFGACSAASPF